MLFQVCSIICTHISVQLSASNRGPYTPPSFKKCPEDEEDATCIKMGFFQVHLQQKEHWKLVETFGTSNLPCLLPKNLVKCIRKPVVTMVGINQN